jgi:hypothetical protein
VGGCKNAKPFKDCSKQSKGIFHVNHKKWLTYKHISHKQEWLGPVSHHGLSPNKKSLKPRLQVVYIFTKQIAQKCSTVQI